MHVDISGKETEQEHEQLTKGKNDEQKKGKCSQAGT